MVLVPCAKCRREFNSREGVACSICKKNFEFDCAGISEKLYLLMAPGKRKTWKCKPCVQLKGTLIQSNVNTRRRRAAAAKIKETGEGCSSDKKNPQAQSSPLNIPCTSPQQIVSIDEISHKSTKSPPQINDSHILSDDETLYDLYGTNEILTRSLVDIANHNSLIEEMKTEIDALKSSLGTTQEELENTILEKNEMERRINKLTKDIQVLKNICQSPVKTVNNDCEVKRHTINKSIIRSSITATPPRKTELNNRETFELEKRVLLLQQELTLAKTEIANLNRELDKCLEVINQNKSDKSYYERSIQNSSDKHHNPEATLQQNPKIFIYGLQQCRGLAAALIKTKTNTQQEEYNVSSFIKPNAFSEDIIREIHPPIIHSRDRVILSIGENDLNPKHTVNHLRKCLQALENKTVIVLQVLRSRNINTYYLNSNIERLCNQFVHCHFISLNNHVNSKQSCKKILCTIDRIDYDRKFLHNNLQNWQAKGNQLISGNSKNEYIHTLTFNELQSTPKSDFFRSSRYY